MKQMKQMKRFCIDYKSKCLILRQLAHIQTVLRIGAWSETDHAGRAGHGTGCNSVYKYTKNQRDSQI